MLKKFMMITLTPTLVLFAGCDEGAKPTDAPAAATAKADAAEAPNAANAGQAQKDADVIFQSRCTSCHGAQGKGDGVAAAALNPKPRDYGDKAWQASVTDEYLAKVIVGGGTAVGKSAMMPPNPDLKTKPEVVKALVAKVRSFKAE